MGLFNELKKRNVFRVGAAYLVSAWVIIQVSDIILDSIEAPSWVMQSLLLALGLGFIVALIISWAYELTADGLKKEKDVTRDDSIANVTAKKLEYITLAGVVLVVALFAYQQTNPIDVSTEPTSQVEAIKAVTNSANTKKSIAVLPFVNMSNDPSQEYFSDGMTEEILNVLVKNKQLLVAARTSAFSYKGKNKDIRTIGKELGVDHVLEGSVRRADDELRITAQLIRVDDGFHLWSETYDRKLEKIFVLQEDIAKDISKALSAPLGIKSAQLITNRTTDITAYDLFLKGRVLLRKRGKSIEQAAILMEEVIQKDPEYAPARAMYALALDYIPGYLSSYQNKPLNLQKLTADSLKNARIAVRLDPTLAMAHFALANNYREHLNWSLAEDSYLKALAIEPNNIDVIEDYAQFLQVVGRVKESTAEAKRGYELEPNTPLAILNYIDKLLFGFAKPDYNKIEKLAFQVLSMEPESIWARIMLDYIYASQKQYQKAIDNYEGCRECSLSADVRARLYYLEQLVSDTKPIETKIPMVEMIDLKLVFDIGGNGAVLDTMEQINDYDSMAYYQTPFMSEIRKTERFKTVMQYLGLADYWRLRHWPDFCHSISDTDFECD